MKQTHPETDFKCIAKFGSYFTKDIPLPVVRSNLKLRFCLDLLGRVLLIHFIPQGTVIDFKRTADGQLITESE